MTDSLAYSEMQTGIDIVLIAFPKIGKNARGQLELLTSILATLKNRSKGFNSHETSAIINSRENLSIYSIAS